MPKQGASRGKPWPHAQLFTDDAEGSEHAVTLTAYPMTELRRRLEGLGDRVAASLNRLPHTERPMLAFEVSISGPRSSRLRDVDGGDFRVLQGGLSWRPSSLGLEEPADVYVLTQSLQAPRWAPAAGYEVPPLTPTHPVFYVMLLPTQTTADAPLEAHLGYDDASFEVTTDLIAFPPHPLLWWGTPPTRKR